jgi:hypothetical protein
MGLFDHLFKTKSPTGGEKMGENAAEGNAAKPADGDPRTPVPQKADPSAFLHPKSFVPRGAQGLTPAPRPPASGIAGKPAEKRAPAGGSPPPAADEIVLTLGDVLSRIPAPYLKPGNHDAKRELRFKISDLSSDIARGRAAVPLSRIAHLVPDIFTRQVSRDEDMEVRLPLQKLVEQIGLLRSRPKNSVVDKITSPVTAAELPPAAKPVVEVVEIEVKREPVFVPAAGPLPAAESSVLEPLPPAEGSPTPTPPIILSEPFVAPKTVDLKPSAEPASAAAPVVLGPPPVDEAAAVPAPSPITIPPAVAVPSAIPASPGAEAPMPAPESVISEPEPVAVPPKSVPQPDSIQSPLVTYPVVPSTPSLPQKIVIDWGAVSSAKEEESAIAGTSHLHDVLAETPQAEAEAEESKPALLESADSDPEETIQLSLAAILRQCPREILVGELPQVDDSVRITLPFAPIDRQLVKGRVEMSALRFIVALPEIYQKHFVAKVGVKVPIPLEEVFQNLPAPRQELFAQPPLPPPVVLAPATPAPVPRVETEAKEPAQPAVAAIATPVREPATPAPAAVEAKMTQPAPVPFEPVSLPVQSSPPPIALKEALKAETPVPHAAPPAELSPTGAAPVAVTTPVEPSPAIAPKEIPKAEVPVVPVAPIAPAEAPPITAAPVAAPAPIKPSTALPVPVIPPIIGVPESSTAEKVAQPPLPTPVEIAVSEAVPSPFPAVTVAAKNEIAQATEVESVLPKPSTESEPESEPAPAAAQPAPPVERPVAPAPAVVDVPPISLAPASQEAPTGAPSAEPVPPPAFVTSAEVNAPPSVDAPKLKLQPPFFRPQFAPPPIFGFAPSPATPEAEPLTKPEPPSVLAGLAEAAAVAPAAPVEPAALKEEPAPVTVPQVEAVAASSVGAAVSTQPRDEKPAPAIESEPSAEMIALAGEHAAPDIAHFSGEPVPFADLGETLAHETTYASELARVVHADLPTPEPAEAKAPAARVPAAQPMAGTKTVEITKPEEGDEHRPVPIVEGLAAAAVAATITDHVPLDFRDAVTTAEEPEAAEETTDPVETIAVKSEATTEERKPVAPIVADKAPKISEPVEASEVVEPPAEAATLAPTAAKLNEATATPEAGIGTPADTSAAPPPVVLAPEPAAVAAAAPPPHPLFPLPKVPAEPTHVEVLPPPSLPLRRFDQDAIQALFMTEETLDLPKISRLAAALPGVYACVIATRDQACTGGSLPEGFDLAALLGLAPRVGEAAGRMPIGQLKHFTLYGDAYSVSFFERNGLSLCAVHRPRSFVPGVREKLVALADELSR